MVSSEQLVEEAFKVVKPKKLSEHACAASVGSALITRDGNMYRGVCIDTRCSLGFCAEHNAIGQMITNGEQDIVKIVAVNAQKQIYAPCGRCREFIYQVSPHNLETLVIMPDMKELLLKDLLPHI